MPQQASQQLIISYLQLRRAIGAIGTALPFVLALGYGLLQAPQLLNSMSAYYHSIMGDVFVGSLCANGVFLICYRGYERRDDRVGDIAGVFAIGVALFPITNNPAPSTPEVLIHGLHLFCATGFFLSLAYFSIVLFRRSDSSKPLGPRKQLRNRIYLACGLLMLSCIAAIILLSFIDKANDIWQLNPVYWLEALATLAFGFSWLVKGRALLADNGLAGTQTA